MRRSSILYSQSNLQQTVDARVMSNFTGPYSLVFCSGLKDGFVNNLNFIALKKSKSFYGVWDFEFMLVYNTIKISMFFPSSKKHFRHRL